MRFRFLVLVTVVCWVGSTGARAGTLTSATWVTDLGFTGLRPPGSLVAVPIAASGTSTATSVAVSLSVPQFSTGIFLPKGPSDLVDLHFKFSIGGVQAITATPNMALAATGVPGTIIVMTANHVNVGVNASMYAIGVNTLVKVPLSVGVKGQFVSGPFYIVGATHFMTVDFYGWTVGPVGIPGLTNRYLPAETPTVTAMGSFALSGMGGGTVMLVSPTKVSIDGPLAQRRSASFTTLKLTFVPEPSVLLLLAAAGASLALVWRRRPH
jgi:hypothetical protein